MVSLISLTYGFKICYNKLQEKKMEGGNMARNNVLVDKSIEFAIKVLNLKKNVESETAISLVSELETCAYEIGENASVIAIDELSEEGLRNALSAVLRAEYWIKLLISSKSIPEDEKSRELSFDCLDLKKKITS